MDCGALVAQRDHQLQDRPTAYTHHDALDFPDERIVATSCLTKIRPISNSSCGTSDIARGCTLIFDFLYSGPNFGALASVAALRHLVRLGVICRGRCAGKRFHAEVPWHLFEQLSRQCDTVRSARRAIVCLRRARYMRRTPIRQCCALD